MDDAPDTDDVADAEDIAWLNREAMRDLARLTRLAGITLVVIGAVAVAGWLWLAVRSQQHLQPRTFALGSAANLASASLLDRIDALVSTMGLLVYAALAAAVGVGLRLAGSHLTVVYGGTLTGAEIGDDLPRSTELP